ncbi:MAG TPA: translocation/assembly module TamB domain-containing protein [Steroidobacteraceae bacterium]|nr:translocation/assembly module TamB domain-containing protein [Steroidobacteraceae bacterium]
MMRRLFHTSWISLAALLLLVGGAIYYFGWTAGGLQRLVWLANRRLGPVTLTISGARGTLHGGLHVDRVVVDHQRVRVTAVRLDGRVALLPLLWQTIHVTQAEIGDVQVQVWPHAAGGPPWTPHFLVGLLNIQADQVRIGHAEVIAPGGSSVAADQLQGAALIGNHEIRILDGALRYGSFEVRAVGSVFAADPVAMNGTARLSLEAPGEATWLGNGQIDGNIDRLAISGVLLAPFNADFHGEALALSGEWHWRGQSLVRGLELTRWGAGNVLGAVHGTLQLSGDRGGFRAQGELDPPGLNSGPLAVDFAGRYAARVLDIVRATVTHRASGAQLQGSGRIDTADGGPRLDLHGQWSNFRWPLADAAAPVRSAAGTYSLTGLRPFALDATGEAQLFGQPSAPFHASGSLAHDGLGISSATLTAYGGQAQLHGEAHWSPAERWSLAGSMHAMNVAALRSGVAGRVNFQLSASGEGFGHRGTLQAAITDLGGTIRGRRVSGRAGVALTDEDWLLQQMDLQLGATRLEADGRIGKRTDLHFAIDAPDLSLLSDSAHGRLKASGYLGGNAHNPILQAKLSGTDLAYAGLRLHELSADINFDSRGNGHADSRVELGRLQYGVQTLEQLRYTSTGTVAAHRFSLQFGAPPYTAQTAGTAGFADGRWSATLGEFRFSDGADLQLSLAAPAQLVATLDGDELRLERLCLHDAQSTFCVGGSRLAGQSQFALSAVNLPLRALTASLSGDTDFEGKVSLEAHAESTPAAAWLGELKATLADASLHHHLSGGRVESFSLGAGRVEATIDGAGLSGNVALDAGAAGGITGRIAARREAAPWRDWPLRGELRLQTQSLGFIDSYVAQVDRVSGRLAANLTIAGTPAAPALNGELKVSDAEVDAYQINLALRDLNFNARLKDTVLVMDGSANAGGDGHARFDGELAWRNALPYGHLHLAGENLRIVNIPEARVQASPDVYMKFNGRRIDVTGTVTLPYARLQRPDQLANAARASSDEVIVTSSRTPRAEGFQVYSDLTLRLGERVTIDTLGLAGRLSGSLRSIADDSGFNRATGELQVEEGKYTAYGRRLDVEHGRLLYSSGPLNDPAIDLRAIKKFPDITAGVNVRGTLRQPRMTFFSDPPVSQSQIVSLLLAGGSLESVQNTNDPTQRSSAARNNMLLQGSALLFQQFGPKVGLDEVSVESDLNNETSLVLGRYLSPRLYVGYGISVVEAINTIKMRYTIGDHWTIKSEAGTERSADLVYTIER